MSASVETLHGLETDDDLWLDVNQSELLAILAETDDPRSRRGLVLEFQPPK